MTLDTGLKRPLSLELSDTKVYEPQHHCAQEWLQLLTVLACLLGMNPRIRFLGKFLRVNSTQDAWIDLAIYSSPIGP